MLSIRCCFGRFTPTPCSADELKSLCRLQEVERLQLEAANYAVSDLFCCRHKDDALRLFNLNQKNCCDPLKKHKKLIKTNLITVTNDIYKEYRSKVSLVPGSKICKNCLYTTLPKNLETPSSTEDSQETAVEEFSPSYNSDIPVSQSSDHEMVSNVNEISLNSALQGLGLSPLCLYRAKRCKKYVADKIGSIEGAVRKKFKLLDPQENAPAANAVVEDDVQQPDDYEKDYREIISQLKEKFDSAQNRSTKIKILSVLPKSWSRNRIQREFGVSDYMARTVKKIVQEKGILESPNPKPGSQLSESTAQTIRQYYESDDISRIMPGMKDVISVKVGNERNKLQKRMVLCNLKEAYVKFKIDHPDIKVGFSKFAELRPPNCILAGAAGTHVVCVCTKHQNVKLMLSAMKLGKRIVDEENYDVADYQSILKKIICNPPSSSCHLGECNDCPAPNTIIEEIENMLRDRCVNNITYNQWTQTDRCNLDTMKKDVPEFLEVLAEKLVDLKTHDFIAKSQASFLKEKKQSLLPGEVLVIGDFSENYSFTIQSAAQGYHWINDQATLHPWTAYFKDGNGILQNSSLAIISDCLTHDVNTVSCFQKTLIQYLKDKLESVKQIFYFSDGAASQYKNRKNFLNTCLHDLDYGISAEWHCFATSHGKNECDGIGGTVKRLARIASLQRVESDHIMTPIDLFHWAQENLKKIDVRYVSALEVKDHTEFLKQRFENIRSVLGTRSFHAFVPASTGSLLAKTHSKATMGITTILSEDVLTLKNVQKYVILVFSGHWWLAEVTKKLDDSQKLNVVLLEPHGPAKSFKMPPEIKDTAISFANVIATVEPTISKRKLYKLPQKVATLASRKLGRFLAENISNEAASSDEDD